jgi:hypothetical protein
MLSVAAAAGAVMLTPFMVPRPHCCLQAHAAVVRPLLTLLCWLFGAPLLLLLLATLQRSLLLMPLRPRPSSVDACVVDVDIVQ